MNFIRSINFNKLPITSFKGSSIPQNFNNNPNNLERNPKDDSFELTIGYVNDTHGQANNMMRILSGIKGDLRLSAGDNDIGDEKNRTIHLATTKFLNLADIKASALGNHELDMSQQECIEAIKRLDGDMLSINYEQVPIDEQDPEFVERYKRADLKHHLKKSKVVEVKGEKIALIGASPMDMLDRLTHPKYYADSHVDDLDETIEKIQEEVDKYKEQGINKIILLSHLGHKRDVELVEKVSGIDVIVSGHTHELLEGIKEGKNLFYSPEGEPVIMTEAGRDGNYFGELKLKFNKDGIITQAQNNLAETRLYPKNLIHQYIFDRIMGDPEEVGYVQQAPPPPKSLVEENPHANFVCDVMKAETGADIALWHHSGVRNFFHAGTLDSRDVKDLAPFLDYVVVANVSEKTIVDAFKKAIQMSYDNPGRKPGLFAVSGLGYTVDVNNAKLKSMTYIDKQGHKHLINVNKPSEDKFYKVVADEFLMSAGADYNVLAPEDKYIEKFNFDKDVMVCNYLKKHPEPIVINQYGRINFVNNDKV